MTSEAAQYWENRYREQGRTWSGRVNVALEREVNGVAPGTALDLGCGEGGDALWLAHNGWSVTAVDIAPSAIAVGAAAQRPGDEIEWVVADLAEWQPPRRYDLVTASFLHSFVELPREEILRRAATAVASDGLLLIVGHAGVPHGATHTAHEGEVVELPSPEEMLDALRLDPAEWTVLTKALVERPVTAPDGSAGVIDDCVLMLRRNPAVS
jgi:SAM-dependent methyltransferase